MSVNSPFGEHIDPVFMNAFQTYRQLIIGSFTAVEGTNKPVLRLIPVETDGKRYDQVSNDDPLIKAAFDFDKAKGVYGIRVDAKLLRDALGIQGQTIVVQGGGEEDDCYSCFWKEYNGDGMRNIPTGDFKVENKSTVFERLGSGTYDINFISKYKLVDEPPQAPYFENPSALNALFKIESKTHPMLPSYAYGMRLNVQDNKITFYESGQQLHAHIQMVDGDMLWNPDNVANRSFVVGGNVFEGVEMFRVNGLSRFNGYVNVEGGGFRYKTNEPSPDGKLLVSDDDYTAEWRSFQWLIDNGYVTIDTGGANLWQEVGDGRIYYNFNNVGIGTANPTKLLETYKRLDNGQENYTHTQHTLISRTNASTSIAFEHTNTRFFTKKDHISGANGSLDTLVGVNSTVEHDWRGLGSAYAYKAQGKGVLGYQQWTKFYGYSFSYHSVANHKLTSIYAFHAAPPSVSGSIINKWGLHIDQFYKNYLGGSTGIGTAAPTTTLDVNGYVRVRSHDEDNTLGKIAAFDSEGVLRYRDISTLPMGDTNLWKEVGDGRIYYNGGNVGIGTATPSAKLHVVGDFRYVDGNEAEDKILASDANGVARWESIATLIPFATSDEATIPPFTTDHTVVLIGATNSSLSGASAAIYSGENNMIEDGLRDVIIAGINNAINSTGTGRDSIILSSVGSTLTDSIHSAIFTCSEAQMEAINGIMAASNNSMARGSNLALIASVNTNLYNTGIVGQVSGANRLAAALLNGDIEGGYCSVYLAGQNMIAKNNNYSLIAGADHDVRDSSWVMCLGNGNTIANSSYSIAIGNGIDLTALTYRTHVKNRNIVFEIDATNQGRMYVRPRNQANAVTGQVLTMVGANGECEWRDGDGGGGTGGADSDWTIDADDIYNANTGNVGVGNSAPSEKFHITGTIRIEDGTEGAGKVLTSDADGVASWQTPASAPPNYGNRIYQFNPLATSNLNFFSWNVVPLSQKTEVMTHTDFVASGQGVQMGFAGRVRCVVSLLLESGGSNVSLFFRWRLNGSTFTGPVVANSYISGSGDNDHSTMTLEYVLDVLVDDVLELMVRRESTDSTTVTISQTEGNAASFVQFQRIA